MALIGFLIILPFLLSSLSAIYYFVVDIMFWMKFGFWKHISFLDSLIKLNILNKNYSFELSNYIGIEKIVNGLLYSNAYNIYFILAVLYILVLVWILNVIYK